MQSDEEEKSEDEVGSDGGDTQTISRDKDGFAIFDLNTKKKLCVKKYGKSVLVDIREYFDNKGEQCPTKKGVALTTEAWAKIKSLIPLIDQEIAALKK